jgi:hypothetical protein
MKIRFFSKLKLIAKIIQITKEESNDYVFGGKVRNLINHFQETGEIKKDPVHRKI